jgi:hypothetical protein
MNFIKRLTSEEKNCTRLSLVFREQKKYLKELLNRSVWDHPVRKNLSDLH